jgi:hypothetical protein
VEIAVVNWAARERDVNVILCQSAEALLARDRFYLFPVRLLQGKLDLVGFSAGNGTFLR